LKDGTVDKIIEDNFVFPDLETDKDLLWTLLLFSGYLTMVQKTGDNTYELRIPNYELKIAFKDNILQWLKRDVKVRQSLLRETTNYLVEGDLVRFEDGFRRIMQDTFSYYDTAKNNEYVFQAYLLGLLAILGDDYVIKSNRESGGGRYDILLLPKDKTKKGIVLELKQTTARKDTETDKAFTDRINKALEDAQNQIERNKYYQELLTNDIPKENILKIPIVFAGKEPYIRKIMNYEL
jgi:hypothetical protein